MTSQEPAASPLNETDQRDRRFSGLVSEIGENRSSQLETMRRASYCHFILCVARKGVPYLGTLGI